MIGGMELGDAKLRRNGLNALKSGKYICIAQSPGRRSSATTRGSLPIQETALPSGDGCAVARQYSLAVSRPEDC